MPQVGPAITMKVSSRGTAIDKTVPASPLFFAEIQLVPTDPTTYKDMVFQARILGPTAAAADAACNAFDNSTTYTVTITKP